MTSRTSTAAPILAVLAVVLPSLALGLYVAAYVQLGTFADWRLDPRDFPGVERIYGQRWQPVFFTPAARVEAFVRGCKVEVTYESLPHEVPISLLPLAK
jgi:hypothetical protein